MPSLDGAVADVLKAQKASGKQLAIVVAGHNGSGKSTMWYERLADTIKIPLINADRMMMSILPQVERGDHLPPWAVSLRDKDTAWMSVAQQGVKSFVAHAMLEKVPFATETVFSHWKELGGGRFESKVDQLREMQAAGYFVVLFFVGLTSDQLSLARVLTRVAAGGHAVDARKIKERFPRTQKAIGYAIKVADAAILIDNSRTQRSAFTVSQIRQGRDVLYDIRVERRRPAKEILAWLDVVDPL
jgi:predicted ABC-type ATPase